MPFDQPTRNALANMVVECRRLLIREVQDQLAETFGIQPGGVALALDRLSHLDEVQHASATALRDLLDHYAALSPGSAKDKRATAYDRMVLEIAFTILNRLAALRLCEERELIVESVRRGPGSDGAQVFERLAGGALGDRHATYVVFLALLFDELALDLGVLFDRTTPQSAVFPRERCLEEVLALLDTEALAPLWREDETIGWIYQYFNPADERRAMRDASSAPRNGRELAVRNQFFTPRYVVEFLGDNSLGRIWYEMRQGKTGLAESCRLMIRKPDEEIPFRAKKDPRALRMLDPAGGSGHFALYCFDLFETIYREAWDDEELGPALQKEYPEGLQSYLRDVPRLILERNLHLIDIDPRPCQIASLALWLRAQRSWQAMGLKAAERPRICKANVVCAEPMPGEEERLEEFVGTLQPPVLGQLVRVAFARMQLAGEAGSLLKIEKDLEDAIAQARHQWLQGTQQEQLLLFPEDRPREAKQLGLFDTAGITDEEFWQTVEEKLLAALQAYVAQAENGAGTSRRLFAEDAQQGLAFIDLCRRRYDVVLMNPPFGAASLASKTYIDRSYPRTKNDVYAAFVERFLGRLVPGGRLGAITSRTGFFLSSFQKWREEIVLKEARPIVVADLGYGVMDAAMVEAAAYCLERVG